VVRRLGLGGLVTSIVVFSACVGGTPAASSSSVIRIGIDLPLSGAEARAATPALNGIEFYVRNHPTIDGYAVSLRTADDQGDPSLGAANVRAFLTDPRLVAMLGPFDAAVARAEIPIANAETLAMITPATSNPCLTRDVFTPARLNPARVAISCRQAGLPGASELRPAKKNNFFRLTTTDDLQGAAAAEFAFRKLHVLRVGVISDHESYGQGLAYAFSARFAGMGGTVLGRLDLDPKNPTATAFLRSMKDAGTQAIYYGGGTQSGGCAIRADMATMFPPGEAVPFLGGDGIAEDPACVVLADPNSAGIYATVPIVDAQTTGPAEPVIHTFKSVFGKTADYGPYTVLAYDATAVLYSALDHAIQASSGALPARSVVTAWVADTAGLEGATGALGFDAAGDTTNRVVTIFEATSSDPRVPWREVDAVDFSARLPY